MLLGLFFLLGTYFHYQMAWLYFVKKQERVPSGTAPFPALAGMIAWAVCPVKVVSHLFWLPVLLDIFGLRMFIGSFPNLYEAFWLESRFNLLEEYVGTDCNGDSVSIRFYKRGKFAGTIEYQNRPINSDKPIPISVGFGGGWQVAENTLILQCHDGVAEFACADQIMNETEILCVNYSHLSSTTGWLEGVSMRRKTAD